MAENNAKWLDASYYQNMPNSEGKYDKRTSNFIDLKLGFIEKSVLKISECQV